LIAPVIRLSGFGPHQGPKPGITRSFAMPRKKFCVQVSDFSSLFGIFLGFHGKKRQDVKKERYSKQEIETEGTSRRETL